LLGDVWFDGETQIKPAWDKVAALSAARLHLYGKEEARPGRKMGHITLAAPSAEQALGAALECARLLHLPHD